MPPKLTREQRVERDICQSAVKILIEQPPDHPAWDMAIHHLERLLENAKTRRTLKTYGDDL